MFLFIQLTYHSSIPCDFLKYITIPDWHSYVYIFKHCSINRKLKPAGTCLNITRPPCCLDHVINSLLSYTYTQGRESSLWCTLVRVTFPCCIHIWSDQSGWPVLQAMCVGCLLLNGTEYRTCDPSIAIRRSITGPVCLIIG